MTNIKMSTITFGGEEIFNITDEKSVHFNKAQTLTEEEKKQARTNIGAVSAEEVGKLSEDIATKASAIKETASGEVIVVTDSAGAKPLGLAIDGKSTQDGEPTPDNPIEIVNVGKYDEASGKYAVEVKCTTEDGSKETTATVYLDEPLRGIGEYKDRICQKDGVWGVERWIKRVYFTGDEPNINMSTVDSGYRYNFQSLNIFKTNGYDFIISCNRLIPGSTPTNKLSIHGNAGYPIMWLPDIATIEDLRSYLRENETYMEGVLAEPTFTPFEDQTIFDGLSMFYPTTILSNDCNANMEVTYIADTKAYIDKKFAELATAMV